MQTQTGAVVSNKSFHGLSSSEANGLNYYIHFSPSSSQHSNISNVRLYYIHHQQQLLLYIPQDIHKLFLFQETIDKDKPTGRLYNYDCNSKYCVCVIIGCWSVTREQGGQTILLRNLFWLGQIAYHKPHTTTFGHFYFGTGERTTDLLFML